jgi:uncharacterized protein with HEPN domain
VRAPLHGAQDKDYQKSICMSILQIGELDTHLTDEFVIHTKDQIPWKDIVGMRNRFAQGYLTLNFTIIFNTATTNIQEAHDFCQNTLKNFKHS